MCVCIRACRCLFRSLFGSGEDFGREGKGEVDVEEDLFGLVDERDIDVENSVSLANVWVEMSGVHIYAVDHLRLDEVDMVREMTWGAKSGELRRG
jgi:hypothetical protein